MFEINENVGLVVADFFIELVKSARESAANAPSPRRVGCPTELGVGYKQEQQVCSQEKKTND